MDENFVSRRKRERERERNIDRDTVKPETKRDKVKLIETERKEKRGKREINK